jgi:hypothetical protein
VRKTAKKGAWEREANPSIHKLEPKFLLVLGLIVLVGPKIMEIVKTALPDTQQGGV